MLMIDSCLDSCDDLEDTQDFDIDFLEIHASEKTRVEKFYEETCHRKLSAHEKPCSTTWTVEIPAVSSRPLNLT